MTVKKIALFLVAFFFFFLSPATDVRGEEELRSAAPEGQGLLKKIEELEKDIRALKKEAEARRKETEARERLEVTEEEKAEKEKGVLSAAGRRYMLGRMGTLGLEYNFGYNFYTTDRLEYGEMLHVTHEKLHVLTNTIIVDYVFLDNLTLTGSLPFVYKYEKVGASDSNDVSDVGDMSFGLKWQPFKSGGRWPTTILSAAISSDTGQSPYDINLDDELSTGSGFWSCSAGASFSKAIDPVVAFGSLSYSYNFDASGLNQHYEGLPTLKKVEPGDSIGFSMGIGYALSYDVSLTFSFAQIYNLEKKYYFEGGEHTKSAAYMTSVFSIGTGWQVSPKTRIFINAGIGLTDDDPDFLLSFRLPFDFKL